MDVPFFRSAALEQELNERNKVIAKAEATLRDIQSQSQEDAAEAHARIGELTEINAQAIF